MVWQRVGWNWIVRETECRENPWNGDDAMQVPLLDLKAQYATIKQEILAQIN
jgi:hypothetical protein